MTIQTRKVRRYSTLLQKVTYIYFMDLIKDNKETKSFRITAKRYKFVNDFLSLIMQDITKDGDIILQIKNF